MKSKRDRRSTPQGTSLALGRQLSIDDCWTDAVPPDGMELKADTASVKVDDTKVSMATLNGEGTSKDKYIGIISNLDVKNDKKEDVEAIQGKNIFRGCVSGFVEDKRLISVSDFDWKRLGQFDERGIRLLDRNHGLLIKSMEKIMTKEERFDKMTGTRQVTIDEAWN